ncbi:hypothetical protein Tco_0631688 [Tanacetum coccineum]
MMTVKYCLRGEIKKLEIELWNLKVKGSDVASYTLRFQDLALMHGRMFPKESDEVERYIGGLPDMIRGNVMSYQPKIMEKAIEFANDEMDQKVLTISKRQAEQKRKLKFNAGNNQGYQQKNKRQNTGRAYTVGPSEKREYTGSLTKCSKCNYHHNGLCTPKCNKFCHLARDCRSSGNANTGAFKRECPKLKNKNHGNQGENGNALAKVYVVGNAGTNPDFNVVRINDSDYQYAVSIKEDIAYSCLHSPKTTKETSSICRIQRRPIRRIKDIVCEYSGRYQARSLLQETPIRRIQSLRYACMTRSSTSKLFTPYKEPEREIRSSKRHFKTLSLDELRSPDFNLFFDQEYSEEEAETMAETMEQYISKTRADYDWWLLAQQLKTMITLS